MAARTTQAQLQGTADRLNSMLEARGSTARVDVTGRNGNQGLDLAHADGRILKTITVGTKGEVWDYMRAMMEALWLLEEPYVQP